ncbi:MAG: tripartite tricarboxylate transporter TctB family protein [Thermomicrobiales bacterium]
MRVADSIAALCVALIGATTIALARRMPYEAEYGPGSGFLPFWLGVVLLILAVFLLRDARIERPHGDGATDAEADPPAAFAQFAPGAFTPWLIFLVSTVAVSFLFERLGFALSVGLFMLVTMRWVARLSWPSTIAFALVTPVVLYLGFVRILMVPLPLRPAGF